MHADLGKIIVQRAGAARGRAILAAPFIKSGALDQILTELSEDVELTVVTRWVPEEIAAGVSDVATWDLVRARRAGELRLYPELHAKYFRFDDEALVGSANITAKALGWAHCPNLELLVSIPAGCIADFEAHLLAGSFEVDARTADAMRAAADITAASPCTEAALRTEHEPAWFPRSLQVQHLYECYEGNEENIIRSVFEDGVADLAALRVPKGLERAAFANFVAARLHDLPVVAAVDGMATTAIDRRRGQALLSELGVAPPSPSCEEWDRLVSWLAAFLPFRFRVKSTFTGPALERSQLIR